jgi:hypothetical protein
MPNGFSKKWPALFLSAIRVGADLLLVWPRFAIWLLVDKRTGVIRYAKNDRQRAAIQRVAELYGWVIAGETVAESDWRAASAAAAAAAADADAAADAADAAAYVAKRGKELSIFAEGVVQILIAMDAPGCQWLPLTEVAH